MAEQAARVIDGGRRSSNYGCSAGRKTAYVLTSVYRISRSGAVDHLVAFLQKQNISTFVLDKGLVLQALLLCRPSGRVSFADAHALGGGTVFRNKSSVLVGRIGSRRMVWR